MMKGNDSNLCFSLYIRLHRIFTPFSARDTNMMCGAYEFFAKCQKNHALLLPKGRRAKNILVSGWLGYHAREADAQANDDWSQSHFTRAHTHTHTHNCTNEVLRLCTCALFYGLCAEASSTWFNHVPFMNTETKSGPILCQLQALLIYLLCKISLILVIFSIYEIFNKLALAKLQQCIIPFLMWKGVSDANTFVHRESCKNWIASPMILILLLMEQNLFLYCALTSRFD